MSNFRDSSSPRRGYSEFDPESGEGLGRKKSLIRPERSRMDESHPRFHYTQVANQESNHILKYNHLQLVLILVNQMNYQHQDHI